MNCGLVETNSNKLMYKPNLKRTTFRNGSAVVKLNGEVIKEISPPTIDSDRKKHYEIIFDDDCDDGVGTGDVLARSKTFDEAIDYANEMIRHINGPGQYAYTIGKVKCVPVECRCECHRSDLRCSLCYDCSEDYEEQKELREIIWGTDDFDPDIHHYLFRSEK